MVLFHFYYNIENLFLNGGVNATSLLFWAHIGQFSDVMELFHWLTAPHRPTTVHMPCPACTKLNSKKDLENKNIVKVETKKEMQINNFSNALDFFRLKDINQKNFYYHHVGIYGYQYETLKKFIFWVIFFIVLGINSGRYSNHF